MGLAGQRNLGAVVAATVGVAEPENASVGSIHAQNSARQQARSRVIAILLVVGRGYRRAA
jgi:hypothetical protein